MRGVGRLVDRVCGFPPIAQDAALGLGVAAYGLFELNWFGQPGSPGARPFHLSHLSLLVFAMMSLPLALRRRSLLVAYALIQTATLVGIIARVETNLLDPGSPAFILMIVLIFAVADRAPAWVAILAMFAQVGILLLAFEMQNPGAHDYLGLYYQGILGWFPYFVLSLFVGWAQRRRRALTAGLEARAEDLRLERERIASQAAAAERIRIAQELRTLVSRGVERMTGQARRVRRDLEMTPAPSDAISAIESMGRRTLVEMRRLLLVLRGGEAHRADLRNDDPPRAGPADTGAPDTHDQLSLLPAFPTWLRRQWIVDLGLVLLLLAGIRAGGFTLCCLFYKGIGVFGVVLATMILGALLIRSRLPFSVMCTIAGAVFVWILATGDTPTWSQLAVLLAAYTVAARKERRWAIAAVVLGWFALTPYVFAPRSVQQPCFGFGSCLFGFLNLAFGTQVILAVAGGVAMRVSRRINLELRELTQVLVRTREERIRLAVVQERTRLARDLHDVVAHALTVMVVQAGAARALVVKERERAKEALAAIERAGREAIAELDFLSGQLGLAGIEAEESLLEPQGHSIHALVAQALAAGLRVEQLIDGEPRSLDAGLELAVYRIVQEALTNVSKHAPGARAWIEVRYGPDRVEIEITDTGPTTTPSSELVPGAGLGLVGIAERASLFGGSVEAGPTREGGFRVWARLQRQSVLV